MSSEITEKEFAECIRNRLVKQLISVNEQLEQFAYVASHDLREPLRTIVCFTDLLIKEYGDRLDEVGRQYMEINRQAAIKMEALVANILEYGRLGQSPERLAHTNCKEILQQVMETLDEPIKATQAQITHSALPTLLTDPLHLRRLFQNIIGNAIKYQKNGSIPVLHISAEGKPDHWIFSVSDNGIGIDPDFLEVIFDPFKRLHGDGQYTGSGIGLAICKRIVENLGGKIWAQSSAGEGSTFFFTLPKRKLESPPK